MHSNDAVIHTLLYSDVFSFPLTKKELWLYLQSDRKVTQKEFTASLTSLSEKIAVADGYFAISQETAKIHKRRYAEKFIQEKMKKAINSANFLSHIPSVLFIGVSGGLAARNVTKNDDIDIFVITESNSLWITRLLILLFLELQGTRRKRSDRTAKDSICVNMIIEENEMQFPFARQDLYTAREIAQMHPLFERGNTYREFLNHNSWVHKFLPNALQERLRNQVKLRKKKSRITPFLLFCNRFAKTVQYQRIMRKTTREEIRHTFLAFHPKDYRVKILETFEEKKRLYYEKI